MTSDGKIRCPSCDGTDIRHSLPRGILDSLMNGLRRVPRRCRACERRFYVPQSVVMPGDEADDGPGQPE